MVKIPLSQGQFALVDDEDFEWLNQWKWSAGKRRNTFYAFRSVSIKGEQFHIYMHRLITEAPKGKETDHANGNGLDNRRRNLRVCTVRQNQYNQAKRKNSLSQYKGVSLNKRVKVKKWVAGITKNGKNIHLGYFKDEIDAAKAYDRKAKELCGEFAKLNFG